MSPRMTQEQKDKREETARWLAQKDGQDYDKLDEVMTKAYLHNADEHLKAVEAAVAPAPAPEPEEPVYQCQTCKDTGILEENHGLIQSPCPDCAGLGGLPETTGKTKEPELKPVPVPKKGQYFCGKCGKVHVENKKTGQKHLKFRVDIQ